MGNIVLNADDLRSIEMSIDLTNETTHTSIIKGSRRYGGKQQKAAGEDLSIRLLEFTSNGVILDVPENTCAMGHLLTLHIEVKGAQDKLSFGTAAKVVESDSQDDSRQRIAVEFQNMDLKGWLHLNQLFSSRQNDILDLFNRIKGVE